MTPCWPLLSCLILLTGVPLLVAPRDVLECLTGIDPDAGSGALEHAAALIGLIVGAVGIAASRLRVVGG